MATEYKNIDYLLRSTWLTITKMYNDEAAKHDSSMVLGFTLLSIDPKNGTPSTALGPKMGIESTSLSRTLDKLVKRKLVTKMANPDDGRSVIIKLTPEGLKLRDLSKEQVLAFYSTIAKNIPLEKMNIFFEVITIINQLITENKIFPKDYEKTH